MKRLPQRPPLAGRLIQGLNEAIQFTQGKLNLITTTVEVQDPAKENASVKTSRSRMPEHRSN